MTYRIDNVDIGAFGAFPALQGQKIALEGIFDMPMRKSPTERDWGNSLEPLVDVEDIEFDERELTLNLVLPGTSSNLNALKTALANCRVLSCDFGSFNVVQSGSVSVSEYDTYYLVKASFKQIDYSPALLTSMPSFSGSYRLEDFDLFNDFGMVVTSLESELGMAERIASNLTGNYHNALYRKFQELTLNAICIGATLKDIYYNIEQFSALVASSGLKKMETENDILQLYFKTGMRCTVLGEGMVQITIKASIVDQAVPGDVYLGFYNGFLTVSGNIGCSIQLGVIPAGEKNEDHMSMSSTFDPDTGIVQGDVVTDLKTLSYDFTNGILTIQ